MKKTYIAPLAKAVKLTSEDTILAGSMNISNTTTTNAWSKSATSFDDVEDEEE